MDAFGIARTHVTSWKETYDGIVDRGFLEALSVNERFDHWTRLLDEEPPPWVHVAVDSQGQVIGFASGGPTREPWPGISGELYAIYLDAAAHGLGIGRELVLRVTEDLMKHGITSMIVWVLEANPHRGFYEALGADLLTQQMIPIGGKPYRMVAYAWRDLELAFPRARPT
ncbi:MAG TPA: GNAT family N-acetyltransferase [Thermoplasmata archaeon]|nr:GNAT family N-acetyltransferase [Thermoplasmata archaeon]